MSRWNSVAIVGVGLLGGSIGLALQQRGLARQVVGLVRRDDAARTAESLGAVTRATTDPADALAGAELVVVCTPVATIAGQVRLAAERAAPAAAAAGAPVLLTDVGSTKETIVEALDGKLPPGAVYVGSHPLAGSEKTGPEHARGDLFEGRLAVVTPTAATPPDAVERIEAFWQSLGASVVRLDPATHDRRLAATSHLPHLVASALAAATPPEALELTATGWRDTTRIAGGDVALWRQIFRDNREPLLAALEGFEAQLRAFRRALENGEFEEVARLLEAGKQIRDAVGN